MSLWCVLLTWKYCYASRCNIFCHFSFHVSLYLRDCLWNSTDTWMCHMELAGAFHINGWLNRHKQISTDTCWWGIFAFLVACFSICHCVLTPKPLHKHMLYDVYVCVYVYKSERENWWWIQWEEKGQMKEKRFGEQKEWAVEETGQAWQIDKETRRTVKEGWNHSCVCCVFVVVGGICQVL